MPEIRLVSVYQNPNSLRILYRLLAEREEKVNISHRRMPSWSEHVRFVKSRPYKSWYLIMPIEKKRVLRAPVGAAYLSKSNEIGLFIFKKFRGAGFGSLAAKLLMKRHPKTKRFLANINPRNKKSIILFKKMGFRHIQNTYELIPSTNRRII